MPRKANDYTGISWGNWEVLERDGELNRNAAWLCRCTKCRHEQRITAPRIGKREGVVCEACSMSPPSRKLGFSDEQLVQAWQTAANIPEVANKLGAKRTQVYFAAHRLRQHGVPLKKMPKGNLPQTTQHYAAMKALAESLAEKSE